MLDSSADFSQKYFHPAKAVACWIDPMLEQVSKNAFSLRFGPLGWFSYPYYLFYEYLAPIIEVIGVVVTLLTLVINIINIPYTIVFFLCVFCFWDHHGHQRFFSEDLFPERLSFKTRYFSSDCFGFRGSVLHPVRHIVREDQRALLDLQEKARMGNDPTQRFWRRAIRFAKYTLNCIIEAIKEHGHRIGFERP